MFLLLIIRNLYFTLKLFNDSLNLMIICFDRLISYQLCQVLEYFNLFSSYKSYPFLVSILENRFFIDFFGFEIFKNTFHSGMTKLVAIGQNPLLIFRCARPPPWFLNRQTGQLPLICQFLGFFPQKMQGFREFSGVFGTFWRFFRDFSEIWAIWTS